MEIDEVYQQIGESGRQQLLYGAALFLLKVYSPFIVLQYTFVARSSTFACTSGGVTLQNDCFDNSVRRCSNLTFTASTVVSEWSLVCDRNWMAKATMSALMFGFLLGAVLLGNLADTIGRKTNLVYTLLGVLLFNLVSGLTTNYAVYITARFLVGFCISGNILSTVVLVSELVGSSYRGIYGMAVMGAFPVGIVALALTASYIQDWRQLTLFSTLLGTPFIFYHWYLVESPRWLLNMNRASEAKRALATIAQGNGVKLSCLTHLKTVPTTGSLQSKESLRSLFRSKSLVKVLCILCYNWFVNGAAYYGLTLASGEISSDLYTGVALSGVVELPAVFLTYIVIQRAGRRLGLASFMMASGASCLLIHLLSRGSLAYLGVSCALMGKMFIAASFKAAYILTGEIFATSIRNSGVGLLSAVARVGSILSPFIVMAGETLPGVQFTIFGILGITGGMLSLWLPETKDKPLPETVGDMLGERTKKLSVQSV